jgi:hypothetical protein
LMSSRAELGVAATAEPDATDVRKRER